jgi:hypothetical protein
LVGFNKEVGIGYDLKTQHFAQITWNDLASSRHVLKGGYKRYRGYEVRQQAILSSGFKVGCYADGRSQLTF